MRLMTPLLTAVSWSKLEAVKCFIELGAKIDTIDKDGKSGLFLAARLNELRILKVLLLSILCLQVCMCVCVCVCMFVCVCVLVCV